jgi:hypothetical protein
MNRTLYEYDDTSSLAALDFSYGGGEYGVDDSYGGTSALDALPTYTPRETEDTGTDLYAIEAATEDDEDETVAPLITVTNPHGTVTVSVFMDGSIQRVKLAPTVTRMSESQLAEEIIVIAELARRQARASQHAVILDSLSDSGAGEHDTRKMCEIIEDAMGLTSPEQADADQAHVFAVRYPADDDQQTA